VQIDVRDEGRDRFAGGIVGRNVFALTDCVALGEWIDVTASGKDTKLVKYTGGVNAVLGGDYTFGKHVSTARNTYYRADMAVAVAAPEALQTLPVELVAMPVDPAAMRVQPWWENAPGFAFGQTTGAPWIWDEALGRPVLYWEKHPADPSLSAVPEQALTPAQTRAQAKTATSGEASPDIAWRIEDGTLIVTGKGDVPGNPSWALAIADVAAAEVGDGITSLGHHAFAMSKLSSFVLGKDVENLKTYAFFNCNNLKTMEVCNPVPPKVGNFVFMGTPVGKATLVVPAGSKAAYEKAGDWKKFGTIVEK
jgi:hypothetical protein